MLGQEPRQATRALLVGEDKRTVVSGDPFVIGRSRECDLVLDDPNVSRRHAELRREDGGWAVHDLGELLVGCGGDQLGELLRFELGEIGFGDRDLVRHDIPPVYGCYLE